MTLVAAPAGFGKSTLVSSWLEQSSRPAAWLSLEADDSDVGLFIHYVIAAIRTLFPEACPTTLESVKSPELPSMTPLVEVFFNELNLIDKPFVLVLDDYQKIDQPEIHQILNRLVQQQPRNLRLVMLSRHDPPLSLHLLRARGELVEVRQADLSFQPEETSTFLLESVAVPLTGEQLALLHTRTEGWPVGLRLVALNLHQRSDIEGFIREMTADARHVQDYLVTEVLSHLEPAVREMLLGTCVLDRFCAPLCDAVVAGEIGGEDFLDQLQAADLFIIPLDGDRQWFRYHHLFQSMLRRTLIRRYSADEVAAFYRRATSWFEEHGFHEDALHHALAGDAPEMAAGVIARCRVELMNSEQFHRLRRMVHAIPGDLVLEDPELLLAEAWMLIGFRGMVPLLDRVEALMKSKPDSAQWSVMRGEYEALRSLQHYAMGDGPRAVASARSALAVLPESMVSHRGFAVILLGVALQMTGEIKDALDALTSARNDRLPQQPPMFHARVLAGFCFVHWVQAELGILRRVATEYLAAGKADHLLETVAHGQYFLGIAAYACNDLTEAQEQLEAVVQAPFVVNTHNTTHAAFALALLYMARGEEAEARGVVNAVMQRARDHRITEMVAITEAFQAELDWRSGHLDRALDWAAAYDPEPLLAAYRFYYPQLTLARVLLASGNEVNLRRAGELLDKLDGHFRCIHNPRFQLDTLVLQGLRYDAAGNATASLNALSVAVGLARPGRIIRAFLDQGARVGVLLANLEMSDEDDRQFVHEMVTLFGAAVAVEQSSPVAARVAKGLKTPLTRREFEILVLLSQRMSNREIAERLFISPATVKRHSVNLYEKLEVHGRREAVTRAVSIGLLAARQA